MTPLDQLKLATNNLVDAHDAAHEASEALHTARLTLANTEMAVTMDGLQGSNAEARKAFLLAETFHEREGVNEAETAHRAAQHIVTLCELKYRYARERCAMHRAELTQANPGV